MSEGVRGNCGPSLLYEPGGGSVAALRESEICELLIDLQGNNNDCDSVSMTMSQYCT